MEPGVRTLFVGYVRMEGSGRRPIVPTSPGHPEICVGPPEICVGPRGPSVRETHDSVSLRPVTETNDHSIPKPGTITESFVKPPPFTPRLSGVLRGKDQSGNNLRTDPQSLGRSVTPTNDRGIHLLYRFYESSTTKTHYGAVATTLRPVSVDGTMERHLLVRRDFENLGVSGQVSYKSIPRW